MGAVVVTNGVGEGVGGAVVGEGVSGKAPLSHQVPPNYDSEVNAEGVHAKIISNKIFHTSASRHTTFS